MRRLQQLNIGIFEQLKLDWADFSSNKLSSKNTFGRIINCRLQNVKRGCSPLQFQTSKSISVIGIQSCRWGGEKVSDLSIIEGLFFMSCIMHDGQSLHFCSSSPESRNSSNVKYCQRPGSEKQIQLTGIFGISVSNTSFIFMLIKLLFHFIHVLAFLLIWIICLKLLSISALMN